MPQEVTPMPYPGSGRHTIYDGDQVLQVVKFTDKKVPGLYLDLDEDLQAASCFTGSSSVAIKWG